MGCSSSIIQAQAVDHILHLARSSKSSDQMKAAKYMAQVGGKDDDASKSEKKALVDGGAIGLLVRMLCLKNSEVQLCAIAALQHYSVEKDCVSEIAKLGGTRTLVALTAAKKAKLRLPAMLVLKNMCKMEEVYKELVQIWPMKDFRALLDTEADNLDLDMEHMAYSILFYMTKVEECAATMVQEGGIQALLNDLRNPFKQLFHKIPAAKVFANLAACVRNHAAIVKQDGIKDMLALIKFPNLDLQRAGIEALAALSANSAWKDTVVDEGSPEAVFALMASQTDALLIKFGALTIRNLISLAAVQATVVRVRAMRMLIELTRCGSKETETHAVVAVATLASNMEYRQKVVDEKGLEALLPHAQMDSDGDPVALQCARNAIWPEARSDTAQVMGVWTGSSSSRSRSSGSTVVSRRVAGTSVTSGARSQRERDLYDEVATPSGRAVSNKEREKEAAVGYAPSASYAEQWKLGPQIDGAPQPVRGLDSDPDPDRDNQTYARGPSAVYGNGGNGMARGRGRGRASAPEVGSREGADWWAPSEQVAHDESGRANSSSYAPPQQHYAHPQQPYDSYSAPPQVAGSPGGGAPGWRWASLSASGYSSSASAGDPRRGHNYDFSPGPPPNTYGPYADYHDERALYNSNISNTPPAQQHLHRHHRPPLSPSAASQPGSPANFNRGRRKSVPTPEAAAPYAYAGPGRNGASNMYGPGGPAHLPEHNGYGAGEGDRARYMSSISYAPPHPHLPHMIPPFDPSGSGRPLVMAAAPTSGRSSSSQHSSSLSPYPHDHRPSRLQVQVPSVSLLEAPNPASLARRGWGYVPSARA